LVCDICSVAFSLSLILKEEDGMRVSENKVLRKMYRLQREELTSGWRKLYNEELHNLVYILRQILLGC
jgi:hypothetical protein